MGRYLFYSVADKEQDAIFSDTKLRWGELQAERYIRKLHDHLSLLCDNKALWRRVPGRLTEKAGIQETVYVSRFERHYIFFRQLPSGRLGVMSLLHVQMDIPDRLAKDLQIALRERP